MVEVVRDVEAIVGVALSTTAIVGVAFVAANIWPRLSPMAATVTVAVVTVVPAAAKVCVSVIAAAVKGVNA